MERWDRREFLKNISGVTLTAVVGEKVAKPPTEKMPMRVLGRTKVKVPMLGLGFGPIGSGLDEKQALSLMEEAIDLGVFYWDAAPAYARAQEYIRQILPKVRDKVFIVTKTGTDDGKRALEILERTLRTFKTDSVDLVHVHNVGDYDPNRVLSKGGVLEGLREAQKRGWVRFIGLSGHLRPSLIAKALDSGEFDVVMTVFNFVDRFTYDFEGKVLPVARKHKAGIVAMKVLAAPQLGYARPNPARLSDHSELAIRYALSLPDVACAVIGMFTIDELRRNVEIVKQFKPLTESERKNLEAIGKQMAQRWGAYYGDPT